eukprot:Clim_evm57s146 gene=Clim_evmTU57s146
MDFDFDCMAAMGRHIEVLNMSWCNIAGFESFALLQTTKISVPIWQTHIADIGDILFFLPCLNRLHTLEIENNPVSADRKLRDLVVLSSRGITMFNGREIKANERIFIQNRERAKMERIQTKPHPREADQNMFQA